MKRQSLQTEGQNLFTAYGEDHVYVNSVRYTGNLAVLPDRIIADWTLGTFTTLTIADFEFLASLESEIILLGTGKQPNFPSPELLQPLVMKQKNLEVMNTHSACRTFNILVNERRSVVAAILAP